MSNHKPSPHIYNSLSDKEKAALDFWIANHTVRNEINATRDTPLKGDDVVKPEEILQGLKPLAPRENFDVLRYATAIWFKASDENAARVMDAYGEHLAQNPPARTPNA